MKNMELRILCFLIFFAAGQSHAETFYEVGAGVGRYDLDITTRLQGDEDFFDESTVINLSLAAYRQFGDRAAFGAVVEYNIPSGRDELAGTGEVLGFRPVNVLVYISKSTSVEFYGGAAQYDWRKTANGYYVGSNIRYDFADTGFGAAFDLKYYWDLNVDSAANDDIIVGFYPLLKLFYRFQ